MLRDLIPAKYRKAVYSVLGTVIALEGIFDLVPEGAQTKILEALAVLGFGLAASNTNKTTDEV
jgi:hypothetical protein